MLRIINNRLTSPDPNITHMTERCRAEYLASRRWVIRRGIALDAAILAVTQPRIPRRTDGPRISYGTGAYLGWEGAADDPRPTFAAAIRAVYGTYHAYAATHHLNLSHVAKTAALQSVPTEATRTRWAAALDMTPSQIRWPEWRDADTGGDAA